MIDLIETYYMVEIRPIWPTFFFFFFEKIFVRLTFGIKVINKFEFFFLKKKTLHCKIMNY